jgi:hypothetical protein
MADAAAGTRVRVGDDVLASRARLATGGRVGFDPLCASGLARQGKLAFPARLGALKARYGAAEDHLAAQIARIVKTQRSAVHKVSA